MRPLIHVLEHKLTQIQDHGTKENNSLLTEKKRKKEITVLAEMSKVSFKVGIFWARYKIMYCNKI